MPRVFIVDDDVLIHDSFKRGLAIHGYETIAASNGRETLRLLATQQIDLIIRDIFMPEKDGIELLTELRTLPRRPKGIIVSGDSDNAHMPQDELLLISKKLGADCILAKPVPPASPVGRRDQYAGP